MFTWSDDMIMASSFAPYAVVAKQIAPGTSSVYSASFFNASCDSCNISGHTKNIDGNDVHVNDLIYGNGFKASASLLSLTWPLKGDVNGSDNHKGNLFGGGVFFSIHYSFLLEIGAELTAIQWFGPVYLGATYGINAGEYFGKDADNGFDLDLGTYEAVSTLNLGGGAMLFMNNHGLGYGMHCGLRRLHLVRADYEEYTGHDKHGLENAPVRQEGLYDKGWAFYYGIDLTGYTNLPLLKENKKRGHSGYVFSLESGFYLKEHPVNFWSLTASLLL